MIHGYDEKELVAVAEMMKRSNITPEELTNIITTFKKGYQLGQKELSEIYNKSLKESIKNVFKK